MHGENLKLTDFGVNKTLNAAHEVPFTWLESALVAYKIVGPMFFKETNIDHYIKNWQTCTINHHKCY